MAEQGATKDNNIEEGIVDSDDDDETFQDATDSLPVSSTMDFHTSVAEAMIATQLFLNNKFNEAKSRMQPWSDRSMYHALSYGTIMYLQATMTFEPSDIDAAVVAIKNAIHVCGKFRRKSSMLSKTSYDALTPIEVHAELCYAESLLVRALLMFIQDDNIISFIKGGLKIRNCYHSFKECIKIMEKRNWTSDDEKPHFESGIKLGVGLFNLLLSSIPPKLIRLLEIIGFYGNKKKALAELEAGAKLEKSLRSPLCTVALLAYHTIVTYILGTGDGDIDTAERVLRPCLRDYPKGALFLFFAGRIEEIKGNLHEAILKLEESVDSQEEWRQFHHLCFWELMWCHAFRGDWLLAMKYAERLSKESKWSKSTYIYQKAAFLMMCDEQSPETKKHVAFLFSEVPKYKQRIAGKSIPQEKFAVAKSKRFFDQSERLTLPAYELIFVWNGFSIIGKKMELLDPILTVIEKTINEIVANKASYEFYNDDYCLALLLKGVSLRYKKQFFQAEQCFQEIIKLEKSVKEDTYLIPYTLHELAQVCIQRGEMKKATEYLDNAKQNYKGYQLESRLHFRIQAARTEINPNAAASPTKDQENGGLVDINSLSLEDTSASTSYDVRL